MTIPPSDSELPTLLHRPVVFLKRYRLPLLLLLTAATADTVTTINALHQYGVEVETHLVQRWIVYLLGVTAGVPLAKTIQIGFVLFVAAWWRPWCPWLLTTCAALYALAAISNHFVLL